MSVLLAQRFVLLGVERLPLKVYVANLHVQQQKLYLVPTHVAAPPHRDVVAPPWRTVSWTTQSIFVAGLILEDEGVLSWVDQPALLRLSTDS